MDRIRIACLRVQVAVIDVKGHVHLVSSTKIDKSQKLGLDGLTCVDVAATDDLVAVGRDDNTVALLDGNLRAEHNAAFGWRSASVTSNPMHKQMNNDTKDNSLRVCFELERHPRAAE